MNIVIGEEYFEGPDPIDLTNTKILSEQPFMTAPKMDGQRFLMYHDSKKPYGNKTYLVNRKGDKIYYQSDDIEKEECLYYNGKMEKNGKINKRKKKTNAKYNC